MNSWKNKGSLHQEVCKKQPHPSPFSTKETWNLTRVRYFYGTLLHYLPGLLAFQIKSLFIAPAPRLSIYWRVVWAVEIRLGNRGILLPRGCLCFPPLVASVITPQALECNISQRWDTVFWAKLQRKNYHFGEGPLSSLGPPLGKGIWVPKLLLGWQLAETLMGEADWGHNCEVWPERREAMRPWSDAETRCCWSSVSEQAPDIP